MSLIAKTLKVETTRLEKGEVAIIDNIPYEVVGTERLFHYVVFAVGDLPANAAGVTMNILNLRPEVNELYNIDCMGIDGMANVRVEYPAGANRMTPHQVAEFLDQVLMPKTGCCCGAAGRVYFWCVPDRFPMLNLNNPLAIAIQTVVYFYGWKYRTKIVTAAEVETKRAMGIRVLEAESYYPTA